MTLSEELAWRGFQNQTTLDNPARLDGDTLNFYWGVDPSADSMTVGHLAIAMMVRHFITHGHRAILLVGGATGLIGDPDGKTEERSLVSQDEINHNKGRIVEQYRQLFAGNDFEIVDNYDWFKDVDYLQFLREVGKHVPMRQMLGREFVQSRLGESGSGISYAEFSYSLIQGYDFLVLNREKDVSLQVCGADQWGNSIAGVELIRRIEGREAHVWSAPLIINKTTGVKFGKSEAGAVWLDPAKTTPTQFYQFWINCDDEDAESFLKIYTLLSKDEIEEIMRQHAEDPGARVAQKRLAAEVTKLVHGKEQAQQAEQVTAYLTESAPIGEAADVLHVIRQEIASVKTSEQGSIPQALAASGLTASNSEARRLLTSNAISINGQKVNREQFVADDFQNGRLLLRRGKAYKDSALVELGE
jgi:tyrosyl-tRNA synthetase